MKTFKIMWRNIGSRVAMIVTACVLVFMLVVTLVATQSILIYETICSVIGGPQMVTSGTGDNSYTADYKNKAETLAAANELSVKIEEEGIVLLKNEDDVLPIKTPVSDSSVSARPKVTVFGKNSVNLVLGGSGSSAGAAAESVDICTALSDAGYDCNPEMKSFYEGSKSGSGRPASPTYGDIIYGFSTGETEKSAYESVRGSYSGYNDAAIVVISRIGGEGYDLPRTMRSGADINSAPVSGARDKNDHYLQLDQNETDMLAEACEHFDDVIVVINSAPVMELGFLTDPDHYAYHEEIKGALLIGNPGNEGIRALGNVLNGSVSPSGHTADTYPRDLTKDPTWANFGNNSVANGSSYILNGAEQSYYYVNYEEGIYVGYRYYETRGWDNEEWYDEAVIYPFGYGLSYSNFTWTLVSSSVDKGDSFGQNDELTFTVSVHNDGQYPAKDAVQLYVSVPYYEGQIEKSAIQLVAFEKTPLIQPGESAEVTLTCKPYDFASYDYSDANKNQFKGYELDMGDYTFSLRKDVHTISEIPAITCNLDKGYTFTEAEGGTEAAVNRFDDVSSSITKYLSRSDWEGTWPTGPDTAERTVDQAFIDSLTYKLNDTSSDPWYTEEMPTQAANSLSAEEVTVKLPDLVGKDYDDPMWDELLNQLTFAEMRRFVAIGNYQTIALENINKPRSYDLDGPQGLAQFMGDPAVYDTCKYPGEVVVACTWNKELAYEMGKMVGNEGLIGNEKGTGTPYTGWYAPAVNIHRSQFAGRNWEYYSEDGLFSGLLGAEVVKGAMEKGMFTCPKHFALNDQETYRDANGVLTWANEQTMREIYFKPFERIVKDGGTTGMMSSFNRIGKTWTGGYYELLTELLRDEWGFEGFVITDYGGPKYMPADQMLRAGGDLYLGQGLSWLSNDAASATNVSVIRNAVHNILYTTANSNMLNGISSTTDIRYIKPVWEILLYVADGVLLAAGVVWITLTSVRAVKKARAQEEK